MLPAEVGWPTDVPVQSRIIVTSGKFKSIVSHLKCSKHGVEHHEQQISLYRRGRRSFGRAPGCKPEVGLFPCWFESSLPHQLTIATYPVNHWGSGGIKMVDAPGSDPGIPCGMCGFESHLPYQLQSGAAWQLARLII